MQYICIVCDKRISPWCVLRRHIEATHNGPSLSNALPEYNLYDATHMFYHSLAQTIKTSKREVQGDVSVSPFFGPVAELELFEGKNFFQAEGL